MAPDYVLLRVQVNQKIHARMVQLGQATVDVSGPDGMLGMLGLPPVPSEPVSATSQPAGGLHPLL